MGEVQRGHERLLHGPLCRRGVELHYQSAATQPHSPDQQRPCQPHPKRLPAGQVGSKIRCPVVFNPSKCKIDEMIMLISKPCVVFLLQCREGEAGHGSGAVSVSVQRDGDHGCDAGLWRACTSLQTDGKKRHGCFGEPDEG